ncbi:MAG: phosphopantetheine-binding protein [Solirubrobacteraceae bacterium]|nr:phosphopantetheine-binding protein [Patulibacter sp.]
MSTTATDQFVITTLEGLGTDGDVTPEATLDTLDIDSLDLAEFAQVVDEELGVQLETKDLKEIKTVADVIAVVEARRA